MVFVYTNVFCCNPPMSWTCLSVCLANYSVWFTKLKLFQQKILDDLCLRTKENIRSSFSVRLWHCRAQKKNWQTKKNSNFCLLLFQVVCSEDSVHVTRTLSCVHWIWSPRSFCARAVQLWRNIIDRLYFQNTTVFFLSCISALYSWFPLSAADHCLTENGILCYN